MHGRRNGGNPKQYIASAKLKLCEGLLAQRVVRVSAYANVSSLQESHSTLASANINSALPPADAPLAELMAGVALVTGVATGQVLSEAQELHHMEGERQLRAAWPTGPVVRADDNLSRSRADAPDGLYVLWSPTSTASARVTCVRVRVRRYEGQHMAGQPHPLTGSDSLPFWRRRQRLCCTCACTQCGTLSQVARGDPSA